MIVISHREDSTPEIDNTDCGSHFDSPDREWIWKENKWRMNALSNKEVSFRAMETNDNLILVV